MKKVLLLLITFTAYCTLGWAQLGVGQQMQNNDFEAWRNETSSRRAPEHWNSLNSGTGSLQGTAANDFISEATSYDNSSCVQLTCRSILGVKANGGITCGRFHAASMSASNTANCTYTHSSNNNFRQVMTAFPDSVYIWTKTSISNSSHEARINIVIHNNVSASNNAIYQDPIPTSPSASVVNTSGAVNEAKVVAKATLNFRAQNNWVQQKIAFDYNSYASNNTSPSYILATFSTNKTAGTGTSGDKLWLDDVVLIYNTRLATLKQSGTNSNIDGFSPDITTYDFPLCAGYPFPTFTYTCQSAHASAEVTHDPSTDEPWTIIRVKHLNQENTVYKDYRINYNIVPAPEAPMVSAPEPDCSPVAHPVTLTATSADATAYRWYTTETGGTGTEVTSTSYNAQGVFGSVTYYVSAVNSAGCESARTSVTATVNPLPDAPTAGSTSSVCSGSTGTFAATLPAGENLTCRWYATNNSSEVLGTGTTLEVANLTQNTTRYASTYNTVTGCESGRVAVTVNVGNTLAVPTNLIAGSHCGAGSVTLSATPAQGSTCQWYASATGGDALGTGNSFTTPSISSSTTYYVASYNDEMGCGSARIAIEATINPIPANPTVSGNEAICSGNSLTLTATAANNADAVRWYDSNEQQVGENNDYTTGALNQNTSYIVKSYNTATGCFSTGITVNVNVKSVPDAPSLAGDNRCGSGEVTLSVNNANNDYTYTWYNANDEQVNTGASYTIQNLQNTSTYHVTATVDGCTGASASVTAIIHAIPALPSVTDGANCGEGTVTLNATTGQGGNQVRWYATAESGEVIGTENSFTTPSISATTTYYVASYNNTTQCIGARRAVTATINAIPAAPVCQNDTLCGPGQAVLTAIPADNCICQWFNANNNEITSGISNETRTLTTSNLSQNTIYRVRSVNPSTNCFSEKTDVQAIIATIPGAPTVSNKARCGAGAITLTATPGANANTCRWYNANGTLLYEGTSYEIANLEETTSFTCKSYNNNTGCESSNSRTVTATVNPVPAIPTVNGNEPICGSGSLQLTAIPGTNANICRWINGNDTTTNNNFSTGIISQSTGYSVQSYNATTHCASENLVVNVVVNSLPNAPQTSNDTQCLGTEVTLTATATDNTIVRWYASVQDNNILYEGAEYHPTTLVVGENNFYASLYDTLTQCTSAERSIATATMIDAPAIPDVADAAHCGPATFTLSVINPENNATYKWYETAQGGDAIHTGTSFTTNELSNTTLYYVSATVANYDCESGRKEVTVTINSIPANPEISGNVAICAGQTLTVSATSDASATNFVWSDGQNNTEGETFTTPTLSENASYSVKAYNADTHCESEAVNFTVIVNANPAAPEVSSITVCQNETAILSATADAGNTCYWYASEDAETTLGEGDSYNPAELTVGTTAFYVSQRDNTTNCESERAVIYATVNPTYAIDYPVIACDSFRWNNELFTESGNYERTLHTQLGCDSIVSLQLTINRSKTTHIDTTVCDVFVWNGQSYETSGNYEQAFQTSQHCDSTVYVHLTVNKSTVGEDHIYLCSNQLPYNYNNLYNVTTAGTYTIHTDNAAGCDSTINLTVTVNTQPSAAINLTPAARCGEGAVTLTAHAGQNGTTCHWYASEDATDALFSGTSYLTNNLAETTTYYVSSYNDYNGHPCESNRQAIVATINSNPAEPTVADQARCGDGQVTFTATVDENANTCRWYLTANTTNISATSLTYNPNINVSNGSTSFYVESYNSNTGCKSGRKEVKAEAFAIPAVPVLTAMSNCGPQQFSINAPATGYYNWYDSYESTSVLDIQDNTTPLVSASRSYFISHAIDHTGISCESGKTELVLTIYPVYEAQNLYDTLCQNETYTQHGLNETFNTAGSFDRVLNTVSSTNCDSLVTLHLWVKETRSYAFDTTVCDSYTWNDETFTASDNITRHFTSSTGCDSVVTVSLTVNKSVQTEFNATECDKYVWNNETYNTSGDYVQHFFTVNNCDSTVTLHLTINNSVQTEFTETACDSYTWNNEVYTEGGDKVQHFQTSKGCDSTVTLHLTINYSNTISLTDAVCAGTRYQANGFDTTFNAAGNYTLVRHDLNQAGCDSTTTLSLTVNPVYHKDVTMTICETALPYTWNDITYPEGTASGSYEHIYNTQSVSNCDSIVTLHLTISNQYVTPLTEHICEGETFTFAGQELNQSGIYFDTLQAHNLCDSIIMLTLTVHESHTTTLEASICLGESYTNYDFNVTPENTGLNSYQRMVQTEFGCDSTINLNLTVNPVYHFTENDTVCANELPITWQGKQINQEGDYTAEYQTINGCDSTITLTLTVNPVYNQMESAIICESELPYTWRDTVFEAGSVSGEYVFHRSTVNGCDSIVTLTLTVNPIYNQTESETICQNELPYTWRDTVFESETTSGEYVFHRSSVNGCDSTVTLTLTINPSYTQSENETICQSELPYTWRDTIFEVGTVSGDYVFNRSTVNGCDSTVTLTLTINPIYNQTENETICQNELPYTWRDTVFEVGTVNGDYVFNRSTINGCDSTVTLTLTVNPTKHTDLYAEICEGDVYEYKNRPYEEKNDYHFTYQTALGCDSTVTLHLTVNPVYSIDTTITICQGMLPYNFADTIFYGSGSKDIMLHTQRGCDSIYHVTLNVTPFITRTDAATICDNSLPFTYEDSTFNQAGVYEVVVTHDDGCNEIITFTLTVNPTYETTLDTTVCDIFVWNNETYTTSGVYTQQFQTISSCDSTVTYHLTVNYSKDTVLTPAICQGESYEENGFSLTPENAGIVYDTLHLQCLGTGCDSTVYLELTVNPSYNHEFDTVVCDQFIWNDHTYTVSDIISHTYTLATGCDSTVTYNLTVNPSYNHIFDTVVCDLFVWNNESYTESALLTHTYTLPTNCDSTVSINLTVNHSKDILITDAICQGENYELNGFSIQAENAGMVYDTLRLQCNGTGCDSTVYLELTVNPSYNLEFDTVVCDQFVWNGNTYTVSDIISHTYTLATGCDSSVTYNLTVNPSYNHTFDTTVCDLFVWNGQAYNQNGTLTHTYTLATGCDSTVAYNLTVNHSVSENQTITICQSELPYTWRDIIFDTETTVGEHLFTYNLETAQGCDSTVNLTLIINPSNEYYDSPVSFCEGGSYEWNGQIITESGLYTDTVSNDYGCYDVYKLVVTVNPVYSFTEYNTVCDNELPIVWQGRQISQAGTYIADYQTINECDSIYQLVLTVNPTHFMPETAIVCDNEEYIWEGHEVQIGQRAAGTYTIWDSLQTVDGCDSVYMLTLTVSPTYNFEAETAMVCDNEAYVWEGHEGINIGQLQAGVYTFTDSLSTTTFGCDSIHTLVLTVTPTYHFEAETATVCDNEAYVWAGHNVQIGQRAAGTYTIYDNLSTAIYGCDSIYTLVLTVNPTEHSVETVTTCSNEEVYSWHERNITATGIYYDTLTTLSGCDSVCELRFTLIEPTFSVFADTTCANAQYLEYGFEVTPTLSGDTMLVRVTENTAGCDSTITVNLYVKPVVTFSFDTTSCSAIQWNNHWYTSTGEYQQTFTAANGCDSIVTLNLTIGMPVRDTIEVVACESHEWDGSVYTQSGIYSKTYPVGCDSIVTLILTINHSTEVTLYDTTCLANHYQEYGFDTMITQMGTLNLQRVDENTAGCDSIINLILTVHRSYMHVDSASTCDNEDFVWQGMHCDSTGIYIKSYPTIHGCDSAFVLYLTVYPSFETDVTDTAIAGTPYHNHGLNFTPQNPGTLNIDVPRTTVDGCDSIVHVTLVVMEGNSIDMHYLDKHITLFPNPTENVFTVSSTIDMIRELTIYDNNGKAVWHQEVNNHDTQVNVENLAPGIYFVRLTMPDNIVTKKLIVR